MSTLLADAHSYRRGRATPVGCIHSRPLDPARHRRVSLDALYHKVREGGRVVTVATLIAIGISVAGERTALRVDVAALGGNEDFHRRSGTSSAPK
jgi:transposase-like protein